MAGFTGPLHQCSIYKSTEAGKKIRYGLGSSSHFRSQSPRCVYSRRVGLMTRIQSKPFFYYHHSYLIYFVHFHFHFYSCSEMLELGKSKPWPEALEKLTNKRTMDVGPLKEYFWPLYLWLRSQRCSLNYKIGWPENPGPSYDPCVVPTTLPDTDTQTSPVNNQPNNGAVHAWYLILIAVFSFLLGC